jgi:hypothetical protein
LSLLLHAASAALRDTAPAVPSRLRRLTDWCVNEDLGMADFLCVDRGGRHA